MEFRGLKINFAELAMALTALGALISAWRGGKAAKRSRAEREAGKGKEKDDGSPDSSH